MFVYSMRANTLKFFSVVAVALIALVTLIAFIPSYEPVAANAKEDSIRNANQSISYDKVKTNEDRLAFLKQFGWECEEKPLEEAQVTIPEEFDKVFAGYNELQKKQGLDLAKYKKKKLMRYTYKVTNYPNAASDVYANILIKDNKVVGGDICSADQNGFIHGFSRESVF